MARTSKPKSSKALEKIIAVSASIRSLALRHRRSLLRFSSPSLGDDDANRSNANRSAQSLYAKSGACVIVAPYFDMASAQTIGSLMKAAGDRNAEVTSAGLAPGSGGIVSGTRYPPTRPMSWYCGSHDTFASSTFTPNC